MMKSAFSAFASALALAAVLMPATAVSISTPAAAAVKKSYGPLKGTIYGHQRRPGGYSYKKSDVYAMPGGRNHPAVSGMTQTGPFDMDGFSEIAKGPFGGTTPYMH